MLLGIPGHSWVILVCTPGRSWWAFLVGAPGGRSWALIVSSGNGWAELLRRQSTGIHMNFSVRFSDHLAVYVRCVSTARHSVGLRRNHRSYQIEDLSAPPLVGHIACMGRRNRNRLMNSDGVLRNPRCELLRGSIMNPPQGSYEPPCGGGFCGKH